MSRTLVDTNVLVGTVSVERREPVEEAMVQELRRGYELCIANQSLFEFWSVVTRPLASNGLGMSPGEAYESINGIRNAFTLLPDPPNLLDTWLRVCRANGVLGRPSHDARLVAIMESYSITRILTFERKRFGRFQVEAVEL